jgi:hypothetical protein
VCAHLHRSSTREHTHTHTQPTQPTGHRTWLRTAATALRWVASSASSAPCFSTSPDALVAATAACTLKNKRKAGLGRGDSGEMGGL